MGIKLDKYDTPENMEYCISLSTDREKEKYVKRIEQIVRSSMEYRDYVAYLKEYVDMNHCAFFTKVENGNGSRVRIEIHHDPLTLFDIVSVVVDKYLEDGIPLNDLYVADEVMEQHYKNMIGLIPLSKSVHQIVHNSSDFVIPLNMIYGDYMGFIHEYQDYISDDSPILEKLERKINETENLRKDMYNKLKPEYVYVEVEGFELPKKIIDEYHNDTSSQEYVVA